MTAMSEMSESELLEIWEAGSSRGLWEKVAAKAAATGDASARAVAAAALENLPLPLQALAANAQLVRLLIGSRWFVVRDAREGGATWAEVAEALECTPDQARAYYMAAIDLQERYVGDLHDAARARAVLADDPAAGGERL